MWHRALATVCGFVILVGCGGGGYDDPIAYEQARMDACAEGVRDACRGPDPPANLTAFTAMEVFYERTVQRHGLPGELLGARIDHTTEQRLDDRACVEVVATSGARWYVCKIFGSELWTADPLQ